MLSDLRKRKLTQLFRLWDTNGDGFIEQSDYSLVAFRVAELSGATPGSLGYQTIQEGYLNNWLSLCWVMQKGKDDLISLDDYLAAQEKILKDKAAWEYEVRDHIRGLATRADHDQDGKGTLVEFAGIACSYGLSVDMALKVAQRMDLDHDGLISIEDILRHLEDFYYSDDPSSLGNHFAGILETA